ncbi:Class I peptide chain release factor [Shewanella baltica OS195]|uniref:Class I peptide chain release factor n=1 Tax=Shewanella baltica (strain OS195) TaxID=399599 RepID=A9L4M3_SHEB9|nr:alternative ribosome rescue aminoacyl-tRNA hydrolase ArfB [Shewanella baltica]ABX51139.1 Class I peptide chain release factor [Shewanella baltica OS195]
MPKFAMIKISNRVELQENEIEWQFIRSSGAGGQHLNKVSTAAQLIFDIKSSSLPEFYQERLLNKADHRITKSGKIIIKCQASRSQDANSQTALEQFIALVASVGEVQKKRIPTRATKGSQTRRLESKKQKGATKAMRQQNTDY